MTADLYITDGTTRINLLSGIDGFHLDLWNPAKPAKNVTWRDSPLTDGRKPALMKYSNATETFNFKVARFTQDDVIYDTQELERLLMKAEEYFYGVNDVPVWLEARGDCETNTRYAVVVTYGLPSDSDPYHKPFSLANPVMSPWTLTVERQHWRHLPPGQSECVELSATQSYYDASNAQYVPLESADDCYVDFAGAGSIVLNSVALPLGNIPAGDSTGTGIRFRSVAVPQGAIIIKAYIECESDANSVNDTCNVRIYGNDVDNAAIFSTYADYIGRVQTTAHVHWAAIPHWVAGTHYITPDISAIVQEIVSRAGWVSGNHMAIMLDDEASTALARRELCAWDHAAVRYEPHLIIDWFDSTTRTFGRTATCNNEVYVANKHNIAQLTHIFVDDGGVFGANLIGAALPFQFLPAVTAVNDAVYFGISTLAPDSGPFNSLVFDISIAQVGINTLDWQYYDSVAAGWHALDVRDNTNADGAMTALPFNTTGVNSVHWDVPGGAVHNWGITTINGIIGYWVRALVGAVGTPPTQQNRDIYTIVTPYIDTTAANVLGDLPALANLLAEGQSGQSAPKPILYGQSIVYAGLRSYSRGANFTSFINLSSEQNPAGIVVSVNGGTATFVDDVKTPSGRAVDWTTGGAAAEAWLSYINIPTALADDFAGKFRCFLRLNLISAVATDLFFRLLICSGLYTNSVYRTSQISPVGTARKEIIDFGTITLPPSLNDTGDTYRNLYLRIDGQALAAVNAHLCDLILLPCDECFIESRGVPPVGATALDTSAELLYMSAAPKVLDMDSTIPRRMIKTDAKSTSGDTYTFWANKIASPMIWQPNERQRWWFFQQNTLDVRYHYCDIYNSLSLQGFEVSRYLSMRGAR